MNKGFIQTWIIIITTFFSSIFISHPPITNIIVATSTVQEEIATTTMRINQIIIMEKNNIINTEYIEATSTVSQSPVETFKKTIETPVSTTTATTTEESKISQPVQIIEPVIHYINNSNILRNIKEKGRKIESGVSA